MVFDWYIYIRSWPVLKIKVKVKVKIKIKVKVKVKVKAMQISTANILWTVADRANMTNTIRHKAAYWLSIRIFTFDLDPF